MRNNAIVDLTVLAIVFWGVWSLRFPGVQNIGLWTMLALAGSRSSGQAQIAPPEITGLCPNAART